MAYYEYKQVRDLLIDAGKLDKYSQPMDKEKYGETLEAGLDGNIHTIAADYIRELLTKLDTP